MRRITRISPGPAHPLFNVAATRQIEQALAASLPPHTLMQRAGLSVAHLALALAPHARTVWIACGYGNNGGDGLEAALHLHSWGRHCVVTWLGDPEHAPNDARASWQRARDAGVLFASEAPPGMTAQDLCIDALLGMGLATRPANLHMQRLMEALHSSPAPVLAVDIPSGLQADTGAYTDTNTPELIATSAGKLGTRGRFHAKNTLTLLTLKPGLFTASGRDAAGTVWFDDLGASPPAKTASAWLSGAPANPVRTHASHKGSYGDVAVIGGAPGMAGAALLAASAALHSGAGRVFACLLDGSAGLAALQPELMLRAPESLDLTTMAVVCGCGGGSAVRAQLPRVLSTAAALVLDADALNAIATDPSLQTLLRQRAQRGAATVLTPHPLEAARLLGQTTAAVQADRIHAAQQLADHYQCTVVLKGSGSVIATHGAAPHINPTGSARLASAGTGDVLAGMVGAALAAGHSAPDAATGAVWRHGELADRWSFDVPLTAGALARGGIF